jgi:hypothetical protein
MNMLKKVGVAGAGILATVPAFAVDIAAAQTELTEGLQNVVAIGGAVLIIAVTVAVFKYVKKAF